MKIYKSIYQIFYLGFTLLIFSCHSNQDKIYSSPNQSTNVLNYIGSQDSATDRSSLAFSDQGAWFAYGFTTSENKALGFTGPLLMTQGQGEWSSKMLSELTLVKEDSKETIPLDDFTITQTSFNSHLEQQLENDYLKINQSLFFSSSHSAIINTQITNLSEKSITIQPGWQGSIFPTGLQLSKADNTISLITERSDARGTIQVFENEVAEIITADTSYVIRPNDITIEAGKTERLTLAHTFIFSEYDQKEEQAKLVLATKAHLDLLQKRKQEKGQQLRKLNNKLDSVWTDTIYKDLLAKTVLTLQNNTRIPAGDLKHKGLFPSYHQKWFQGLWAWDSWKHSAALAHYDPELAKDQIRAMYDFQLDNGFIADCIFRDTSIENHNYRNTKPPLSAWAAWKIYEQDGDIDFIKEIYPKIVKQHNWWYTFRDHDKDGLCEYGSTDGTLIAAKWESGMDNAVRFDKSEMVKSAQKVYSLDQESVDLNAYLYAEKKYLTEMANVLSNTISADNYIAEAKDLKKKIQAQFFDKESGWFYDTSIDGSKFIKVMGCEGWIPLWANVATAAQAEAVKTNMMHPDYFNIRVPFQTLTASHSDFKPNGGYWRGPNWIDQAYFGVVGLHNYGFHKDAYNATHKLIHNAEGVITKGPAIRENYHPITGAGWESYNFSWSAAHYLLLLLNE